MTWERYYPPTQPREVKGGIKAQQRGFGKSWWAKRWLEALEEFTADGRLTRGRAYARKGQVLSVEIAPGQVQARVQGSRPRPYKVAIQVKTLELEEWERVAQAASGQAVFAAKLLGGELPVEIEQVFAHEQLSLFPEGHELVTKCNCPDDTNPCKHIAAVYYLLGEEFDRDPFLIFRLRGLEREAFMELMGTTAPEEVTGEVWDPEPLPVDPGGFWGGALPEDAGEIMPPPVTATIPKRLGPFPFWRGVRPFLTVMETMYAAAAERGMGLLAAEQTQLPPERPGAQSGGKSRDRVALRADLLSGLSWEELCRRYDGRLLRPYVGTHAGKGEGQRH